MLRRHTLRVTQSYSNAVRDSAVGRTPLYLRIAIDEVKDKAIDIFTAPLRLAALKIRNPRSAKYLPGVLALYRAMRLCANSCILEDLIFADEEELPIMVQVAAALHVEVYAKPPTSSSC